MLRKYSLKNKRTERWKSIILKICIRSADVQFDARSLGLRKLVGRSTGRLSSDSWMNERWRTESRRDGGSEVDRVRVRLSRNSDSGGLQWVSEYRFFKHVKNAAPVRHCYRILRRQQLRCDAAVLDEQRDRHRGGFAVRQTERDSQVAGGRRGRRLLVRSSARVLERRDRRGDQMRPLQRHQRLRKGSHFTLCVHMSSILRWPFASFSRRSPSPSWTLPSGWPSTGTRGSSTGPTKTSPTLTE